MLVNTFFPSDDPVENMRYQRGRFLAASDWTQMPDSPLTAEQKQAWADYRQTLRDFPATWTPGPTADFPDPPQ
jgi:hypothetical protein